MPVLNKKTRMVSFRLSVAEYEEAERSCTHRGVRSVSTLARNAVIGLAGTEAPKSDALTQLQQQIFALRTEIERITQVIQLPIPRP